jgi:hypothetical protein
MMRIDRYTKAVLTVIAACLVWIPLGGPNLLPVAHAQRLFPTIIKSPDFGYRVEHWQDGHDPTGTLLVQIAGTWYEARLESTNK